ANFETPQRILAALSGTLRSGQTIRMEQLQFEADSSNINEISMPVLNELYDFLSENPAVFIEIGGHTNSLPPDEVCDRLSTARAKSVMEFLIQKGIEERRLSFRGYGKRVPIADNNTPEGRQQNQRVEIKILRIGRPKEEGGG
ncbi:MAG: OmpA family protein, partial [Saprospiraceae bacterium]